MSWDGAVNLAWWVAGVVLATLAIEWILTGGATDE